MNRNPRIQHLLPTTIQIKRDLTNCDPLPKPKQRWMCPACSQQYINAPIDKADYECVCGWNGDRTDLLLGRTS